MNKSWLVKRFRKPLIVRRVVGHSMSPTLLPSQIVFASSILSPKINSIVIAEIYDKQIIKRASKISGNKFYLSGDNPGHDYGWVNAQSVIATVIH